MYESVLKGVAASVGLEPVTDYGPGLERFFDEVLVVKICASSIYGIRTTDCI